MSLNNQFNPLYPDVLGAIAGGLRVTFDDTLQAAVGIFPRRAYFNQPVEVVVILQSMIDQNMDITVALQIPNKAADGSKMTITTPKKSVSLTLSPGEVGALRLPLVVVQPIQPFRDLPIGVTIRYRSGNAQAVRTPMRGAPPSVLAVSPFKLHALREVEWIEYPLHPKTETLQVTFDVTPKRIPPLQELPKPGYEILWTQEQMSAEKRNLASQISEARLLAVSFTRVAVYASLVYAVDDAYATRGLPLHPGETKAIAKMLTYTLDDRSLIDPTYDLEDQRWFQTLCQVLAHDSSIARMEPGEIVARYLFEPLIYDAIMLGFTLIRSRVRANLGDRAERINYADKVIAWLAGQAESDLVYIYLPLALGGVIVNLQVTGPNDDPWAVVEGMREAYRGRVRLAESATMEIFDMLDKLLNKAEDDLKRARIPR